jgi:hypothetical protein
VAFRDWHNPKSGLVSWVGQPKLSQGYTAIQNRPGLLIETHMLKPYKVRVDSTYELLKQTLGFLIQQKEDYLTLVRNADIFTASRGFRQMPFPLAYRGTGESETIDFLGVEYEETKSDLTGGKWFKYGKKKKTFKIPYFNKQVPAATAKLPRAYIVPVEWGDVISRFELHGVKFSRLAEAVNIKVRSYIFRDVQWGEGSFEGRHTVRFKLNEIIEARTFLPGSAVVDMAHRTAQVAAHMLEPEGPDSFVTWGFFNSIFEQKEYAESYVLEEMARKMLKEDEVLRKAFEKKKTEEPGFPQNPRAILNWFYQRTPYWDNHKDVYPVGKIFDEAAFGKIMEKCGKDRKR